MKILLRVAGAILMVVGVIWVLQGVNILPGSFMTGQMKWAYIGAPVALAGAVLFWLAGRRNG